MTVASDRLTVRDVERALSLSHGMAYDLVLSGALGEVERDHHGRWTVAEAALREYVARKLAKAMRSP